MFYKYFRQIVFVSISDNLITRSAAVAAKRKKQLILGVREMPLSYISLNQMAMLSSIGVMIAPPVYANYSDIKSLDDLENFFCWKNGLIA